MVAAENFEAKLVGSRPLSPAVRELTLERADGKLVDFAPGQWVNLVLPVGEEPLKRAYSIASEPTASARFEIAVTRVAGGPGSEYLHRLAVGSMVHAIGPHGLFTRDAEDPAPALFVATGTGVTPLRSMIRAARAAAGKAPLWLLFGARYEEDILYREELAEWAREHPGSRFEVTLSQASAAWTGRRGYVQAHVPELLDELRRAAPEGPPHVYVCGLERMVKAVRDLVRNDLGVDRKHVHAERYD